MRSFVKKGLRLAGFALGLALAALVSAFLAPAGIAMAVVFAGPIKGRAVLLKRGAGGAEVAIAGLRTKTLKVGAESIDITNDDSGVWKDALEDAGQVAVTFSAAGVTKDHTLLTESLVVGDRSQSTVLEFPLTGGQATKDKVTGNFFLKSYQETAQYKDAIMFEAEFESVGAVTFTAGA